jgi:hypothetical protein
MKSITYELTSNRVVDETNAPDVVIAADVDVVGALSVGAVSEFAVKVAVIFVVAVGEGQTARLSAQLTDSAESMHVSLDEQ